MSNKVENSLFYNLNNDFEKSSKLIGENLIIYKEDVNSESFFQLMKSGYEYMGKINEQISEEFDFSNNSCEFEYDTFNEYEKWLCGVW